jgi:hypothetical protein
MVAVGALLPVLVLSLLGESGNRAHEQAVAW